MVEESEQSGSSAGSSVGDWAIELLRSEEPYRPGVARKQRMQLRLGHAPRRPASLALRAAVALVVLLVGGGAFARATLGRWPVWMVRAYERIVPAAAPAVPAGPAATRAGPILPAAAPLVAPPAPAPEAAQVFPPVALPVPVTPPAAHAPVGVARPRRSAPAAGEDSTPVLEAMRALRRERDPVRARALLATYLDRHPSGTLAEEALALSIEAAVAHRDADAAGLAARYLRLYPTGPFRPLARQTLAAAAQQP